MVVRTDNKVICANGARNNLHFYDIREVVRKNVMERYEEKGKIELLGPGPFLFVNNLSCY